MKNKLIFLVSICNS